MDFLEGALLGPLWSDTDYADKPHRFPAIIYIAVFYGILLKLLRQNSVPLIFKGLAPLIWLMLTLLFMVVSTFLASKYYRLKLPGRFTILFTIGVKYVFGTGFFISLFRPLYQMDLTGFKDWVIGIMNSTVGEFISNAAAKFRIMGLVISGIFSAAMGMIIFVLVITILLILPVIFLRLIRYGQNLLDTILMHSKFTV